MTICLQNISSLHTISYRNLNLWRSIQYSPCVVSFLKYENDNNMGWLTVGERKATEVHYVRGYDRCITVAAGDWKNWGGQEENQSTVSCYFIQVNYLSLLSYIQWKLSNKTMTYKTSLKNILLNG